MSNVDNSQNIPMEPYLITRPLPPSAKLKMSHAMSSIVPTEKPPGPLNPSNAMVVRSVALTTLIKNSSRSVAQSSVKIHTTASRVVSFNKQSVTYPIEPQKTSNNVECSGMFKTYTKSASINCELLFRAILTTISG